MSIPIARGRLDRPRVVQAAVELADEHGLDAASMRGVAERLGVTPMALYKHIANRSQLIDAMLDQVLDQIPPAAHQGRWSQAVRSRIFAARSVLLAHPWARDAIESRTLATATTLAYMDSLMAAMLAGGLSADLVHHAMHTLSTRMWGFTRDVLPTPRVPEAPEERARALSDFSASYPAIVRMATTSSHAGASCDEDAEFAFALDLILDGIGRLHEDGWRPPGAVAEGTPV
ncbi:MAG: TetR/AcrR family transcriptional regulator C-terminal domain-containing protein [Propionicimonas sp.]|uniref:TetR/AcrR family transcriptional regulator C-terminal domain-containing protein n=1 Tax=Propionicimonas sp. TaxID=1955623 RepID=UPI003D0E1FED